MQFERPPLLELIAELKWLTTPSAHVNPALPPNLPQGTPLPILTTSYQEQFFTTFIRESALSGLASSERMVPQGYPMLSYQPVLRIRSLQEAESHMIYQVGPGIFSAHALPPYKNWTTFRPFAERGLRCLLKSRAPEDYAKNFFSVMLRYIDVFTADMVGEISVGRFLTDVLGFSLVLPTVLEEQIKPGEIAEPQFFLRIPLASGLEMRLNILGNTMFGDQKGIMMDTSVFTQEPVACTHEAVMGVWEEAHSAIRKTFVGLTKEIHSAMMPVKEGQ